MDYKTFATKLETELGIRGDSISETWIVGGIGGGNCWDGDDASFYSVTTEREPEFEMLDSILELICPQITFLKYKMIVINCVEYNTYSQNEYYGNSTEYSTKTVSLDRLYQYLKKYELL